MAEMSEKNVERRLSEALVRTSDELDGKILAKIQANATGDKLPVRSRRVLRIAASFLGAGAVAAGLVLALFFMRPAGIGGPEASAGEIIARAVKASRDAGIVHAVITKTDGSKEEKWFSVDPIMEHYKTEAKVKYGDADLDVEYVYEKPENTITIRSFYQPDLDEFEGMESYFDAVMKMLEMEGAQLTKGSKNINGKSFEHITAVIRPGRVFRITIDPESRRIVEIEFEESNTDGSLRTSVAELDYPGRESGYWALHWEGYAKSKENAICKSNEIRWQILAGQRPIGVDMGKN